MQTLDAKTLPALYAAEHDRLLTITARHLLWDWRAATKIVEEAFAKVEANAHLCDLALGPPAAFVCCIRDRLTYDYMDANGLSPPLTEEWIQGLEMPEERAAAERQERSELSERIETLPVVLRAPMRLWLDDEDIPESLGWYVRQGLTLLGRRPVAAGPGPIRMID